MVGAIVSLVIGFVIIIVIGCISADAQMKRNQRFAQEYYEALAEKRRAEMRLEQTRLKLNKMLDNEAGA